MNGTRRSPHREIRTGLEIFIDREKDELEGVGVALLAHAASVTTSIQYAWDALRGLPAVRLKALFSPEHGLMGTHQDNTLLYEPLGLKRGPGEGFRDVA